MTDNQPLPPLPATRAMIEFPVRPPNRHESEEKMQEAVERVWKEFWLPIVAPSGELDIEQVKLELYDAYILIHGLSYIYSDLSGHQASKPTTDPQVILDLAQEHYRVNEKLLQGFLYWALINYRSGKHSLREALEWAREYADNPDVTLDNVELLEQVDEMVDEIIYG